MLIDEYVEIFRVRKNQMDKVNMLSNCWVMEKNRD